MIEVRLHKSGPVHESSLNKVIISAINKDSQSRLVCLTKILSDKLASDLLCFIQGISSQVVRGLGYTSVLFLGFTQ